MMWKKATVVLLIACVLLQQVSASPRAARHSDESSRSSSSSSSSESSEESQKGRNKRSSDDGSSDSSSSSSDSVEDHKAKFEKLFNDFADKYYDFVKSVNDKRKSVAKRFNENRLVSKLEIVAVEELKMKLSTKIGADDVFKNIENSEDAALISRYFKNSIVAITELSDLILKYYTDNLKKPSAEEILIQEALEQCDAYELLEKVQKSFEDFSKSFGEKVRDYVKHLTKTEKTQETKIVKWYDEFKSTDGFSDEVIKLSEFFSIN
nr:uncharacterized protein LOC106622192 [Bactrocera oleae]XP_014096761.2 uncharacterized protein LOC106622192 [Bactrocera oleae]XP_014096762.2 uncharacterized protein LOC106622192 [Bactrocera oleae]XP_036215865.1 uncharacterized protein LOC106622192 [Bactrocera oleae]